MEARKRLKPADRDLLNILRAGLRGSGSSGDSQSRLAVRRVYAGLAASPGGWVELADLRAGLRAQNLSDAEIDATLKELSRQDRAVLAPRSGRSLLTQRDHDAALRIGGEDNHRIMLR